MMIGPDGVALGFRFHPSDEELVGTFLHKIAVDRNPIHLTAPYDTVFISEDLFGTKEPWKIWDEYGGDGLVLIPHLYFCCELKTVTKNGSRINRKVGGAGTWSEGPSSKTVFNSANKPMGRKRNLRYENAGTKHPHHGKWLLDEYSVLVPPPRDQAKPNPTRRQRNTNTNDTSQPTSTSSRLVICRLRKSHQNSTAVNVGKESSKNKKNNNGCRAAGGIKKRKLSSIMDMDEEQPPVNTEEEIIETTASKKMRSEEGKVMLVESPQGGHCSTSSSEYLPADLSNIDVGCSTSDEYLPDLSNFDVGCSTGECLPDLSNFDLETEINWDFDPSMFENCEFGELEPGLPVLDKLLSLPAAAERANNGVVIDNFQCTLV